MKKSLFLLLLVSLATLTSCRITKTITMINAKSMAAETEADFINNKINNITFMHLTEEQEGTAIALWKKEKKALEKIDKTKNSEIAPVIFKFENDFRRLLTPEQLKKYKAFRDDSTISQYFLSDRSMKEIKRIYKLDGDIL